MNKNNGVLLIALGHQNYGRMAANLANSIKAISPNVPICVVYCGSSLDHVPEDVQQKLFDHMVECPEEFYTNKGKVQYMRAKTMMHKLTPFDRTIYLDVDMIWSNKRSVEELFEELKEQTFSIISEGVADLSTGIEKLNPLYTFWADKAAILEQYAGQGDFSTGKLYQYRSEFIYFTRSKENTKFFNLAASIFDKPKVEVLQIGGSNSDEFAFNVASCILHHYPHQDNYCPFYWHYIHGTKNMIDSEIFRTFYGVSIGGNIMPGRTKDLYNILAESTSYKTGIPNLYKPKAKRDFLDERMKL